MCLVNGLLDDTTWNSGNGHDSRMQMTKATKIEQKSKLIIQLIAPNIT